MPRYVAFLRAVNVGGATTVRMETLRRAFEAMGFKGVATYIASGNVIFDSPLRRTSALEDRIEEGLMDAFGHEITPFVRTLPELARIAAFRPFPRSKFAAQDQLGVLFLSTSLSREAVRSLLALQTAADEFRAAGREVYWLRHRGPGGEVYSTAPFDKVIDQPFTVRSMGTLVKISQKFGANDQND